MKYEIIGGAFPAVTCQLTVGECMLTESGAMSWMSRNIKMETTSGGGIGKALGRMFAGEAIFQNKFTAERTDGSVTFASSFPGSIRAVEITENHPIIAQKSAFLCSEEGVQLSVHLQKKVGTGLFGGEGFIMQKLSGSGMAFVEIDGFASEYELAAGESMVVDTGYLAYMDSSCTIEIQTVPGLKNMVFGGEGVFNTIVSGPGKIVLQTMPICGVANSLIPFLPAAK